MKTIETQNRAIYEAPRTGVRALYHRTLIAVSLSGSTEGYDGSGRNLGITEGFEEEAGSWGTK